MTQPAIQIRSEIGPLKRVLLHRPGRELENLMPEYIERLLFDDIPYLKIAREEHDAFCDILRKNGAEVYKHQNYKNYYPKLFHLPHLYTPHKIL